MILVEVGPPLAGGWTVYTVWRPMAGMGVTEAAQMFPDWPSARHKALLLSCARGVRSVTVVDPHHVVAGDIEASSGNVWREYRLHIGRCGNYRETLDAECGGQLYARPSDEQARQVRCPVCGGWAGIRAEGTRWPFDPVTR